MKYTILAAMLTAMLMSCTKSVDKLTETSTNVSAPMSADQKNYLSALYYGVEDRSARYIGLIPIGWFDPNWGNYNIARISIWLLFAQDNLGSSRADYTEALISRQFMRSRDTLDLVKEVDGTDNIAIKDKRKDAVKLFWKAGIPYPTYTDTFKLKTWNYTADRYFIKISASNAPATITEQLHDRYTDKYITIKQENQQTWYEFNVGGNDKNFSIYPYDPHRFEIIVTSNW